MSILRASTVLLLGGLAACGGSSNDPDAFLGTYVLFALGGSEGPPEQVAVSVGESTADGRGTVRSFGFTNLTGIVASPGPDTETYALDESGNITFGDGVHYGGLALDGSGGLSTVHMASPTCFLHVRRLGNPSGADLDGSWHWGQLGYVLSTASVATSGGDATFDGAGFGVLMSGDFLNVEGAITPTIFPNDTYFTLADGSVRIRFDNGITLEGGLSSDREFLVVGGGNEGADPPVLRLYVKHSTAADTSHLDGTFWVGGFLNAVPPDTEFLSFFGTATFDGAGTVEITAANNLEGFEGPPMTNLFPYNVQPDGTLEMQLAADLEGAVTPSGRFAYVVGSRSTGEVPMLVVFVRR